MQEGGTTTDHSTTINPAELINPAALTRISETQGFETRIYDRLTAIEEAIERLHRSLNKSLVFLLRRELQMSQELDDKLDQLSTTADQVVALLSTDKGDMAALQASVDALKATQGDDSAEVAKAQSVLDKLTAAVTPAPATATGTTAPPAPSPADTPTSTATATGTTATDATTATATTTDGGTPA